VVSNTVTLFDRFLQAPADGLCQHSRIHMIHYFIASQELSMAEPFSDLVKKCASWQRSGGVGNHEIG
jgi:hypothetical protein